MSSKDRAIVNVLGVQIDSLTFEETVSKIETFIAGNEPCMVVTADAAGIVQSQSDPELRKIYEEADLVTPDSIGVLWAAKRNGHPLPARVSGVDLAERLCALSADKGYRIYFLGSSPGVAELAAEKMRLKYPGCNIVGARHGFFPADDDLVVAEEVAAAKPDILLVAMGIPRQEKFIRKTQGVINSKVSMGVGGTLDVFSGTVKRAPKLIQKMKMEWLWRTLSNPKKIAKAKNLPIFAWRVIRSGK